MAHPLKTRCELHIGRTFVFKGHYCTVIAFKWSYFEYSMQGDDLPRRHFMHYEFYLTTQSAKGRGLK